MMNYVMIFIVGVIIGIILMAIITAANNIQWGCRDGEEISQGECRTCRHCDPEDKKCDCGGKVAKMNNEVEIKNLKKLRSFHNGSYATAIDKAVKALEADRWNVLHTEADLPKERDWYLGLFKEPDTGFIGLPYICDYVGEVTKGTTNDGWILRHCTDVDNASAYFRNLICVAWQPLPEPYKESEGAE